MAGRATNEPSNYFAVGKQSAKDTEATTFHFIKHLDGTGFEIEEGIQSEREGGDGQEVGLRYKESIAADGQFIVNARAEIAARAAAYALGADAVTAPTLTATVASGVAQEHLLTPTSTLPYLTTEQYFADQIERVSNVQVEGLTIEGEAGRPIKLTSAFVGGGTPYRRDVASVLTPTRETNPPLFFPRASIVIDGAGNTKITKFKLDVKRNLDKDIRTVDLFREDVVGLNFDTDLEFTLKYEDKTLYDKIKYGSGSQIPLDLATGSFKIYAEKGSGTNFRFAEFTANMFDYTGARLNRLDPDGKTMYIDVTAMGRKSATHQITARILTASVGTLV